jgi:hypothetical protein
MVFHRSGGSEKNSIPISINRWQGEKLKNLRSLQPKVPGLIVNGFSIIDQFP